ncbi:unnamed protein product, partial [Prorocentrum cordatum]
ERVRVAGATLMRSRHGVLIIFLPRRWQLVLLLMWHVQLAVCDHVLLVLSITATAACRSQAEEQPASVSGSAKPVRVCILPAFAETAKQHASWVDLPTDPQVKYLDRARLRLQTAIDTEQEAKAALAQELPDTFKTLQAQAEAEEARLAAQKRSVHFGDSAEGTRMDTAPSAPTVVPSPFAPPGTFGQQMVHPSPFSPSLVAPAAAPVAVAAPTPKQQSVTPLVIQQLQQNQVELTTQITALSADFAGLQTTLQTVAAVLKSAQPAGGEVEIAAVPTAAAAAAAAAVKGAHPKKAQPGMPRAFADPSSSGQQALAFAAQTAEEAVRKPVSEGEDGLPQITQEERLAAISMGVLAPTQPAATTDGGVKQETGEEADGAPAHTLVTPPCENNEDIGSQPVTLAGGSQGALDFMSNRAIYGPLEVRGLRQGVGQLQGDPATAEATMKAWRHQVVDELAQCIQQRGPFMQAPEFPPMFRAQVADSCQSNWFIVPGGSCVAFPQLGSGPGRQLGGLIYNIVMSMVIREAQTAQVELGVDLRVPWASGWSINEHISAAVISAYTTHTMGMAFFDDAMFMFLGKPDTLLRLVPLAAPIMFDAFGSRGIRLRAAKGKPTVMVQFRGQGSDVAKHPGDGGAPACERWSQGSTGCGCLAEFRIRGPDRLLALIGHCALRGQVSWAHQVLDDVDWLRRRRPIFKDLPEELFRPMGPHSTRNALARVAEIEAFQGQEAEAGDSSTDFDQCEHMPNTIDWSTVGSRPIGARLAPGGSAAGFRNMQPARPGPQ